jgi:hypothetical protein
MLRAFNQYGKFGSNDIGVRWRSNYDYNYTYQIYVSTNGGANWTTRVPTFYDAAQNNWKVAKIS